MRVYNQHGRVIKGAEVDWATLEWTEYILSHIPDDVMLSERQRRRAKQRSSYTGGVFWQKHNPATSRCRCADCMQRRDEAKSFLGESNATD